MQLSKLILISLIILGFYNHTEAQEDRTTNQYPLKISTHIGINSFNEINIQLEKPIREKLGLELYLGFNYGSNIFTASLFKLWCNNVNQLAITKKTGPLIKFGPNLYLPETNTVFRFLLETRFSNAAPIFTNPRCNTSSSEPPNIDFEWEWDARDVGLMIYYDKLKSRKGGPSFYLGFGFAFRTYNQNRLPVVVNGSTFFSGREEQDTKTVFRFDLGWRFGGWRGR